MFVLGYVRLLENPKDMVYENSNSLCVAELRLLLKKFILWNDLHTEFFSTSTEKNLCLCIYQRHLRMTFMKFVTTHHKLPRHCDDHGRIVKGHHAVTIQ